VEDLTDELLQARWNLSALELMIERSKREKDPELALQAAGLAIDLGIPTVAIRAAQTANIWSDPGGQAVGYAAQAVQHQLPAAWADEWLALPHVAAALAVEVTDDQAATDELTAQWAHAVAESGLAGYEVLSPAQRRAQGLVRRRKATSWARRILTAAAVIVIAGGVSAGMVLAFGPDSTPTDATAASLATTTTTLALEARELQPTDARFVGLTAYRGDIARTGVFAGVNSSIEDPTGYWWKFQTADQIVASPVSFGQWVFVASTDNSIYALDTTTGDELWNTLSNDALRATPAVGEIQSTGVGGQGGTQSVAVYGDTGGTVYFQNVSSSTPFYSVPLDGGIVGSPLIIGDRVVVVSSRSDSAQIVTFLPISREIAWTFPGEGDEAIGPIRGAPAYDDGIIYIATAGPGEQGSLLVLDADTGDLICESLPIGRSEVNPVVADGVVYVLTAAGQLWTFPTDNSCRAEAEGRLTYYAVTGASTAPAISGNILVIPIGPRIAAIDVSNLEPGYDGEWFFETGSTISSAPVIADGRVYFGDGDGVLNVLDLATGDLLWKWDTGSRIVSSPLVMNGVVIVTSTDGAVVAIGDGVPIVPVAPPTTVPDDTGTTTGDTTGDTTTTTLGDVSTTTREPVVTTIIPPTGVSGAQ